MLDVQVIDEPAVALAALDPVRARVLAALVEPGSATTVAAALGLPRQQVNYHVRTLESHGLVDLVEERPRRGLVERVVQASATGFVVSPTVLGPLAADPDRTDRLSARYLIALAARAVREVAELSLRATRAGKSLPTLAVDTEVRFASAAARAAFTRQLATAVADLVATYHDETATGGRRHRVVVLAHPTTPTARSDAAPGGTR
jgi:DNA-binding transcriptional ArsR family regulator